MVRHDPRSRPQTLEQPQAIAVPALVRVAREVSHGRTTVVLTWKFRRGTASVWKLLTDAETLRVWAPYTADRDLSQVGRVVLTMLGTQEASDIEVSGVVLVAESPRLLEHSWANDMLAWRITPAGTGCQLTLRHTLADETMASASAAGWHLCVKAAASLLSGSRVDPIRGTDAKRHGWAELNERYAAALGVAATRTNHNS